MVKLDVKRLDDGSVHLTVGGKIDEHFDPAPLVAGADGQVAGKLVIHLGAVRSLSSLGVRAFESFVQGLPHEVVLIEVSPAIAAQLTMIPNLLGPRARVESARLPFVCPACGAEKAHSVSFALHAAVAEAPRCGCGAMMELDGLPEQYLPA